MINEFYKDNLQQPLERQSAKDPLSLLFDHPDMPLDLRNVCFCSRGVDIQNRDEGGSFSNSLSISIIPTVKLPQPYRCRTCSILLMRDFAVRTGRNSAVNGLRPLARLTKNGTPFTNITPLNLAQVLTSFMLLCPTSPHSASCTLLRSPCMAC